MRTAICLTMIWVVIAIGSSSESAGQTGFRAAGSISAASTADIATEIAVRGEAAGMVVVLPPPAEGEVGRLNDRRPGRGLFLAWAGHASRSEQVRSVLPPPGADLLSAYARAHADARFTLERGQNKVPVLSATAASACHRALRQRLDVPVHEANILYALARLLHHTTGVPMPGGFVGSCTGAEATHAGPFHVEPGATLQSGLNEVVGWSGGAVWVAVQGSNGQCSVGLIQKAALGGGVCRAPLVADIATR